jgi:hypothetical protein
LFRIAQVVSTMDSEDEFDTFVQNEILESSSSDNGDDLYTATHIVGEVNDNEPNRRGSIEGHRVLDRDRQSGHSKLFQDYFSDDPTYGPDHFRRRFLIFPRTMNFVLYIYYMYG